MDEEKQLRRSVDTENVQQKPIYPGIFHDRSYVNLHYCRDCGLTEKYGAWSQMDGGKPCPSCGSYITLRVGIWVRTGFFKGFWKFK